MSGLRIRLDLCKAARAKQEVNPMQGRKHTEESKKKMSEARRKYWRRKKESDAHSS